MSRDDETARARTVRRRRVKRWVKAAVSLMLAAAAGAFLTAIKAKEVRKPPAPDGGVQHRDAGPSKDGGIDRDEHRKGMPVRDNLLE